MEDIRSELIEEVRNFLVGPVTEDEILPLRNPPTEMYTSGILFPKGSETDETDNDDDSDNDDSESVPVLEGTDSESKKTLRPNSIGLRTIIGPESGAVKIEIQYGKYANTSKGWERYKLDDGKRTFNIELSDNRGEFEIKDSSGETESLVSWTFFKNRVLNVFLENSRHRYVSETDWQHAYDINISNTIFQPEIKISGDHGTFENMESRSRFTSADDDLFDLLYSDKKIFGMGFGCAAEWSDDDRPNLVRTSIVPVFQEPAIKKFADDGDSEHPQSIDMYELGCFDNGLNEFEKNSLQIKSLLSPLISQYSKWIERQKSLVAEMSDLKMKGPAEKNICDCEHSLKRMSEGLSLLSEPKNQNLVKAFVIANRAMLFQRIRFRYALGKFKGRDIAEPMPKKGEVYWYPFQIAFLLMSIGWINDRKHPDNLDADLIWFPTGGGKTEAYLGISAMVMVFRRLNGKGPDKLDGHGVSVIMRYTLRLLTLQQFERASTLICALEYVRRKDRDSGLGSKPFLIGLWVGQSLTPNWYSSSKSALDDLQQNPRSQTPNGSPWQTSYCPWCGHKVFPKNYKFDKETKWTLLRCSNDSSTCIFTGRNFDSSASLPIVTVDSDIYTRCPSMIVSTVDKFARMPFRPEITNLFGNAKRYCKLHGFLPKHKSGGICLENTGSHRGGKGDVRNISQSETAPPDLFIQDELHLISGPLGSLVGLYETAISYASQRLVEGKKVVPKVIASTATIKGGGEQIRRIFDRNSTRTFPPPGISRKDSFFWWEGGGNGRIFCGLSFSTRSAKYSLARIYAAILQRMRILSESAKFTENEINNYWTLVGYFNSIRELGGANRLVEDDVIKNINFLADQIHKKQFGARVPGTQRNGIDELTSRKTQREINDIRDALEIPYPSDDVMNILLASNMISVGIDIDRLSVMVVNGQPKSSTEYIQAVGRIGRREESPGIVFTFLNPYKPRDLSHYENFVGFHSTIQKYVEPTIVTPFSVSCYRRGAHAVLIAMIRMTNEFLTTREQAHEFRLDDSKDPVDFLVSRYARIELVGTQSEHLKQFETYLNDICQNWDRLIGRINIMKTNRPTLETLWYNNKFSPFGNVEKNEHVLMVEFASKSSLSDKFPIRTPESLRDVEQQIQMEYRD